MGEEHLNLIALSAADLELFGAGKVAGDLTSVLVEVPADRSGGSGGAPPPKPKAAQRSTTISNTRRRIALPEKGDVRSSRDLCRARTQPFLTKFGE